MTITINTNLGVLYAQNAMNKATNSLNKSMLRLSTGYRINEAKDDPAGSFIAHQLNNQINGTVTAYNNVQVGYSMMQIATGDLASITEQLDRVKELTIQYANGTLSENEQKAIKAEVAQRFEEINRIAQDSSFNKLKLLDGSKADGVRIQIGAGSDPSTNALIIKDVFKDASVEGLEIIGGASAYADIDAAYANATTAAEFIQVVEDATTTVTERLSTAGVYNSRLESVLNSLVSKNETLTNAYSSVADADIAAETSNYIKQQMLQQTAATMLGQANQMNASIALQLINSSTF